MNHWKVYIREHPKFGPWYRQVEGRPNWVIKAALIAAGLVIVVPVVLLTLAAILVGLFVFAVFGLIASVTAAVAQTFGSSASRPTPSGFGQRVTTHEPPQAGRRRNVRIIGR